MHKIVRQETLISANDHERELANPVHKFDAGRNIFADSKDWNPNIVWLMRLTAR